MTKTPDHGKTNSRALSTAVRQILRLEGPRPAVLVLTGAALLGAAAHADQLEEVVVTATRRATTTEDIPYSISAISEKTLEDNHVTSLADLSKQIAGVTFVDQGP